MCTNLTVEAHVTLTTDGHSIDCTGTVDNLGTISSGRVAATAFPSSYGGSGGGGFRQTGHGVAPGVGLRTRSAGGVACRSAGCTPGAGKTPTAPSLTLSLVTSWRTGGLGAHLSGADGGTSGSLARGTGANGVLIEAGTIDAGTIDAAGGNGASSGTTASSGGGGGGVIVLAFGSGGYVAGVYNVAGGYATLNDRHVGVGGSGAVLLIGPAKVSGPNQQIADAGAMARFTTTSTGGDPAPTISWEDSTGGVTWTTISNGAEGDGCVVSGATSAVLSLANVQPGQNGTSFRAVYRNVAGTTDSAAATLTVQWNDGGSTPTAQTVLTGAPATFTSTAATSSPATTERWQYATTSGGPYVSLANGPLGDGSTVIGATTATMTITSSQTDENGWWVRALYTNAAAAVGSTPVLLTVEFNGGGTAPVATSGVGGGSAAFTSTPSPAEPTASEQWQISKDDAVTWLNLGNGTQGDGSGVSGATSPTVTVSNLQGDENGDEFRASYSNAAGVIDTTAATLTVDYNDGGTAPVNATVVGSATASFTSTSSGANPTTTEQWQVSTDAGASWADLAGGTQSDGSVVSGATGTTLMIANTQPDENGDLYRATFTNGTGTVESADATLTVQYNDGGSAPQGQTVQAGDVATLETTPGASVPTATIQWQVSDNDGTTWSDLSNGTLGDESVVSGATTATLSINNAQADETGDQYRAVYANVARTLDTSAATLTVQYNDGASAPDGQTVTVTGDASFTSTSDGANPTPTEQWQYGASADGPWTDFSDGAVGDGSSVTGSQTSTLAIDDAQVGENFEWVRAVFTNDVSTVDSSPAELVVLYNDGGTTPSAQTGIAGDSASFTTTPGAANPVASLQWQISANDGTNWASLADGTQLDGSIIAGATSVSLTVANLQVDENGDEYRVIYTNGAGAVYSAGAVLNVQYNEGAAAPEAQTGDAGTSASYTSSSTGSNPAPTFQWQVSTNGGGSWTNLANGTQGDGSVVSGATAGTVTIANLAADEDHDEFRAVLTNVAGSVDSPAATLTVLYNLGGTTPTAQTADIGGNVTFTSTSAGADPAATPQWQVSTNGGTTYGNLADGAVGDGSTVSGSVTTSLTITAVQTDETANLYRCVFTNEVDATASAGAALTVAWNDGATTPQDVVTLTGDPAVFTSATTGANPAPTIQWQEEPSGSSTWSNLSNGTDVAGAKTGTLTITVTTSANNAQYRAVFTNFAGSVDSGSATLQVASTSGNWSGYADTAADGTFTGVAGTFTVPTLACGSASQYAAIWVGLDGLNTDDVEQDGVEASCAGGVASYNAWYEIYGDNGLNGGAEVPLSTTSYPVVAGDVIAATVNVSSNEWTFSLIDTSTAHSSWSYNNDDAPILFTDPDQSTAEWIVERPEICSGSDCSEAALPDFGTVTFTDASLTIASGTTGPITQEPDTPLALDATHTLYALPGVLSDGGTEFTVTWEHS
jgi:hypothetical protein